MSLLHRDEPPEAGINDVLADKGLARSIFSRKCAGKTVPFRHCFNASDPGMASRFSGVLAFMPRYFIHHPLQPESFPRAPEYHMGRFFRRRELHACVSQSAQVHTLEQALAAS